MDFFDKIGETISNKGREIQGRVKTLSDVSKLESQINGEQQTIQKVYAVIGETYFMQHKNQEDDPFVEQIKIILGAQERIKQLQAQIQNLKGVRPCPNCGAMISFYAQFCPQCGAKSDIPVVSNPGEKSTKQCPNCGATVDADAAFCTNCGTQLQ